MIQPRDPATTPRPRRALGLVYVKLDPKGRKLTVDLGTPDKINSKQTIEVPVAVHGLPFGTRAHVTVAAVDDEDTPALVPLDESFGPDGGLEYPQYTRPRVFRGRAVPDILLGGDHAAIARWRREHRR